MLTALIRRALLACLALAFALGPAQAQYRGDFTAIDISKGGITCRPGASCDASPLRVTPSAGAGAISRALSAILANDIYAANWGVVPGDGLDDGPALRAALAAAQARGARLILPPGVINVCTVAGDAEALLRITSLVEIVGVSRLSRIEPCAAAGTRSVILVKPLANGGGIRGLALRNFSIGSLGDTRSGGDGIRFDTTSTNAFIAKSLIQNVAVADAGAGKYAFRHIHDPAASETGGLFGATIQDSELWGGLKFYKTGDSNNVERNIITGSNAGIDYEAISGAAMHRFVGNNITSAGGSIVLRNTAQAKVLQNQLEAALAYTGAESALIVLDNVSDSEVSENNANGYDKVDIVLAKNGSIRNTISSNSTTYSTAQSKVLFRAIASPGNTLGRQRSDVNQDTGVARSRPLLSLDASSSPTAGVFQQLALGTGWDIGGDVNFYQGLFVTLLPNGTVQFRGSTGIKSGTTDSTIAVLPPAYRPGKAIRVAAKAYIDANSWGLAVFTIDVSGNIIVQSVPNKSLIQWDDVSFSAL